MTKGTPSRHNRALKPTVVDAFRQSISKGAIHKVFQSAVDAFLGGFESYRTSGVIDPHEDVTLGVNPERDTAQISQYLSDSSRLRFFGRHSFYIIRQLDRAIRDIDEIISILNAHDLALMWFRVCFAAPSSDAPRRSLPICDVGDLFIHVRAAHDIAYKSFERQLLVPFEDAFLKCGWNFRPTLELALSCESIAASFDVPITVYRDDNYRPLRIDWYGSISGSISSQRLSHMDSRVVEDKPIALGLDPRFTRQQPLLRVHADPIYISAIHNDCHCLTELLETCFVAMHSVARHWGNDSCELFAYDNNTSTNIQSLVPFLKWMIQHALEPSDSSSALRVDQIRSGLHLLSSGDYSPDVGTQFMMTCASLEALLTDDTKSGIAQAIADRCDVLLQPEPRNRDGDLRRAVKKLYGIRSDIAHGRISPRRVSIDDYKAIRMLVSAVLFAVYEWVAGRRSFEDRQDLEYGEFLRMLDKKLRQGDKVDYINYYDNFVRQFLGARK
jgi:hypothetical protein